MKKSMYSWYPFLCFLLFLPLFAGCGGPQKPANPAEGRYADVEKAISEVKFEKALSLTGEIQSKFSDSEYADKARVLKTVLMAGMATGYRNMSDVYMEGLEKSAKKPTSFRTTAFDYYRKQKSLALGLFELTDYYVKNQSDSKPLILACKFPSQDPVTSRTFEQLRRGFPISSEQQTATEENELKTAVLQSLTKFVGAGDDRAKARKDLEGGSLTLNSAEFITLLGQNLLENQKIFARTALNDPPNFLAFYKKAKECSDLAQTMLKAKPDKHVQQESDKLKADLDALQKKIGKTT